MRNIPQFLPSLTRQFMQLSLLYYTRYIKYFFSPYFLSLTVAAMIWASMVQLLPQIIINRIGIIMDDRARLQRFKIGTAVLMTIICIVVFCIWIPVQMGVSERFVSINRIWDRCEKVMYLLLDLFLNLTYLRLVHTRLIAYGLTKYKTLFWFTIAMVTISLSMDVSYSVLAPFLYTGTDGNS
jgi:hypothetical protein